MPTALNFRTLDLNLLRVFDVVMAERNLTRAAERLSITQPAVSNALKRLKESVGEDLLTRAATGVKPTPRAEALWPEVRTALGHLRAALAPGEFNPQTDAASFRIAMADATAALFMPPLVAQIESSEALANVRVLPLATRDPSEMLERGDADLAIGYFPETIAALTSQGSDSPLHHAHLHDSEYVCVMREDHPLAAGELTLDAFCAADHLLVNFAGRPYGLADQALAALNRKRRIVLTVNQYFTAGRVVANSNLLTVLPAYFVEATGYHEHVVTRPLPFDLAGLHVAMVWHQRNDRSSAHQWLRARLLEAAAQHTANG
ncbi:LysR family transcriptional regulator [Rhizobacter sp. Root404]|uniref:LysR family transcriptional regulator n=1 Tax=Rhizobacter sp. Root404 TaxID=1736528 RepID=UPI0006F884EF|nr:LysR family transcriptional regulator [Rhizobacter sp. Root404]KQW35541.1 LysR family transcriptional regulator [Rhizobacter sp. Root404]